MLGEAMGCNKKAVTTIEGVLWFLARWRHQSAARAALTVDAVTTNYMYVADDVH